MEFTLEVVACHGYRPDSRMQLSLHKGSCTLGRASDNDLVLADTERMVSARHARIDVTESESRLTDLSTNGTYLNDITERLPRDQPAPLADGDRLFIGPYEINVSIRAEKIDADDIFGFNQPTAPSTPPAAPRDPTSELMPGMEKHGSDKDILDLLNDRACVAPSPGMLGAAEQPFADARPLDEWLSGPTDSQSMPDFAESRPTPIEQVFFQPPEMDAIPDGYDLLSDAEPDNSSPTAPPSDAQQPHPPPPTTPPLKPSPGWGRKAVGKPPGANLLVPDGDPPKAESVSCAEPAAREPTGDDDHLSTPRPGSISGALPTQTAAPRSPSEDTLSAFLAGLGCGDPAQIADQESFLRSAGALLRVLVGGLSSSLMMRGQFKSELRLGVTTIRATENNPFKFSVCPDDALDRLLFRPNPSFLPPLEAAQQGFDDIQAHEMAMIAGLRSALRALLARFDPETIEANLIDSGLDKVLPMVRKSRSWDEFVELYTRVSNDASDDFTELFGDAFIQAYDDQIQRLARARHRPG